jgi:transcriptional regulator with XRE-family HTH domain
MPPKNLPKKLKQIRLKVGLSQTAMVRALNYKQSPLYPSQISQLERGDRQPSLLLALAYARLGDISIDVLADDDLSLE